MSKDTLVIAIIFLAFVLQMAAMQLFMPTANMVNSVEIEVRRGMTFRQATNLLVEKELIREPNLIVAMGRLSGAHRTLKPGRYAFKGKISPWKVFNIMRKGKVNLWTVRIIEGDMLGRIRKNLAKNGIVETKDFDRLVRDEDFLRKLGVKSPSLEGYLFPDTYMFSKGLKPEKVLRTIVRRTDEIFNNQRMVRGKSLGLSRNDVLTLASIIEKEALLDKERKIISAVYHNRLNKGMRLQADPTSVYGIKPMSAGIRYEDIKRKTPYNTYTFKGLPPGPIASPGLKSIEAALSPADVPYIFFVSNYDGSHTFTETLVEHRRAIKAFRIKRAADKRATALKKRNSK